jgi:putative ABC transport system substrate-binding protein
MAFPEVCFSLMRPCEFGFHGFLVAMLVFVLAAGSTAQPVKRVYRIGVLTEAWAANHPTVEGLKAGLLDLGFEEGRDVTFDVRFTQGDTHALPPAALDLLKHRVDVIFTCSEAATRAAKAATAELPIVFTLIADPVASGIVDSRARPSGNVTGISNLAVELAGKRLQYLKTLEPMLVRVWVPFATDDPTAKPTIERMRAVGHKLGLEIVDRPITGQSQIAAMFREIKRGEALFAPDTDSLDIAAAILDASLTSRIPAMFPSSLWVGHGGLVSYGPDYHAQGMQAARLVAKILRGSRPRDLPVEGAGKIDLVINLKTAAHLGINVPRKVLLRADAIRR